jgi:hypothetical protein
MAEAIVKAFSMSVGSEIKDLDTNQIGTFTD